MQIFPDLFFPEIRCGSEHQQIDHHFDTDALALGTFRITRIFKLLDHFFRTFRIDTDTRHRRSRQQVLRIFHECRKVMLTA